MPITADLGKKTAKEIRGTKHTAIKASAKRKRKKRVACYCRVSTQLDNQADSIVTQRQHFVSMAEADPEVELVSVYYEDGVSGTEAANRPEFQRMMRDCRAGKIDEIWTKSISRWARNTVQLLNSLRELKALGVNVVFEKEHLQTMGSSSELMLALIGSFAEFESKSIKQNTKLGYKIRMQAGNYKYKRPPYGYDATEEGELVINPTEAPVVQRIFQMSVEGIGSVRIAQALQQEGVPTKRGAPWQPATIRAILANITYTGDVILQKTIRIGNGPRKWNKGEEDQYLVTGHHAPIVSHEVFEAAKAAMGKRAMGRSKGDGKSINRYAFSGKLICAHCGHHLHRFSGKVEVQWICTGHKGRGCPMKPISDLDVKNAFKNVVSDLDRLLDEYNAWLGDDGPTLSLRANLSAQEGLRALQPALEPAEYTRRMNALTAEEEELRGQIIDLTGDLRRAAHAIAPDSKWAAYEPFFTEQVRNVKIWNDGKKEFVFCCGVAIVAPE